MLTRQGCRQRLDQLMGAVEPDLCAVLVSDPKHVHRLVNFWPFAGTLGNDSTHHLLVTRDGRAVLLVDNWLAAQAGKSYADEVAVCDWYRCRAPADDRIRAVQAFMLAVLRDRGLIGAPLGVEMARLPAHVYAALGERTRLEDVWGVSYGQRVQKDPDEVAMMRAAILVAETAQGVARDQVRAGMSEIELVGRMMNACTVEQGAPVVMLGDFVSGQRTESGGGPATRRIMRDGDLLILDVFPLVNGYRGDITNTLCVGGRPAEKQARVFDVLAAAMHCGEQALSAGQVACDVYRAVQASIAEAGYGDHFWHHAGHGIGLGHPEAPFLVPESAEPLCPGHVVTLEPGIYVEGWGGMRIEHNYLITDDGFERLSGHHVGLA